MKTAFFQKKPFLPHFVMGGMLLLIPGLLSTQVQAGDLRWQHSSSQKGEFKPLPLTQLKSVVSKATSRVLKNSLFHGDLPEKVTLARIEYQGPFRYDTKYLTDMVLNGLMNARGVMVLNQDIQPDRKQSIHLISYLNRQQTREKGVLLAADYVISGFVHEEIVPRNKGGEVRVVKVTLRVNELRSDRLVFSETYIRKFLRR